MDRELEEDIEKKDEQRQKLRLGPSNLLPIKKFIYLLLFYKLFLPILMNPFNPGLKVAIALKLPR